MTTNASPVQGYNVIDLVVEGIYCLADSDAQARPCTLEEPKLPSTLMEQAGIRNRPSHQGLSGPFDIEIQVVKNVMRMAAPNSAEVWSFGIVKHF